MSKLAEKLKTWKDKLLDLSKRNRLLNFKYTAKGRLGLLIEYPNIFDLWEKIVIKEKKLEFDYVDDDNLLNDEDNSSSDDDKPLKHRKVITNQRLKEQQKTLRNMQSKAKTFMEEQGVNTLYLAFGFLRWSEDKNSEVYFLAPIIIVPVQLNVKSIVSPYTLNLSDDDIMLNPVIAYKLRVEFGIELDELNDEFNSDYLRSYLEAVEKKLRNKLKWEIIFGVGFGLFSSIKMSMYEDLDEHESKILGNIIIQSLAGDSPDTNPNIDNEDLDNFEHDKRKPSEIFHILDADSSQADAILRAEKGSSFILHGPPGTGKSQTISNIIAQSLANDKKILFVSEKMAALEVVKKRLDNAGIGDFCLNLHSHKANKKEILKDIAKVLNMSGEKTNVKNDIHKNLDELQKHRDSLNNYVKQIHTKIKPLNKTFYEISGNIAKLQHDNIEDVSFEINDVKDIKSKMFDDIVSKVYEFARTSSLNGEKSDFHKYNYWYGAVIDNINFELRHNINSNLERLIQKVKSISMIYDKIESELLLKYSSSHNKLFDIVDILSATEHSYRIPTKWILDLDDDVSYLYKKIDVFSFKLLYTIVKELFENDKKIKLKINKDFGINYEKMCVRFETKYKSFLRIFKKGYWQDKKTIEELLEWVISFREIKQKCNLNESFIFNVCNNNEKASQLSGNFSNKLSASLDDLQSEFNLFIDLFDDETKAKIKNMTMSVLIDKLSNCKNSVSDLEKWIDYKKAKKNCIKMGLVDFLEKLESMEVDKSKIVPIFEKRFYYKWLSAILEDYPAIDNFRKEKHEDIIKKFKNLDALQLEIATKRILKKLIDKLPLFNPYDRSDIYKEYKVLKQEIAKKSRIKPIRKLLKEIPNLLLNYYTPCLMMSPLSVSLFLDMNSFYEAFDIIIFDEASQVHTENAIGAIARGKQLIIAGDRHQLPPTNFFNKATTNDDEDDEEYNDVGVYESILDEAIANSFLEQRLRWHYRSRHEHLIAFSNVKIYNNSLITFPSNVGRMPNEGVEYIYVEEGIYESKKGNIIEAQKIAELVFEHFEKNKDRSLGVVAFGKKQQWLIEDTIRHRRREHQEYEHFFDEAKYEAFFVKNLENVQGDERDTIIFSVGYGKNSSGKMKMQFGPLSQNGGERRLNVAITRAKYNIKLVGSIQPEDIDINKVEKEGPKLLRSYIDFAKNGESVLLNEIKENNNIEHDSPFEKSVYDFLDTRKYKLTTQVGCSGYRIDMAVKHPTISGKYILGIECDGASYHSSRTARERDRLRQDILEKMGWDIYRIWSTDWIKDHKKEGEKLIQAIENQLTS